MNSESNLNPERSEVTPNIREGMVAGHMKAIIECLGEDPKRQGLLKTPLRVEKSLRFLTSGYDLDPRLLIQSALFSSSDLSYPDYDETQIDDRLVLVQGIEFYSMCEHHMLPFFGEIHIAYIPNQVNVGLSKLPRVVEALSRQLQVQERLTNQLCALLDETLNPLGVAVAVEASHLCMMMRGVQKQGARTMTTATAGIFRDQSRRAEFLRLITKR